LITLIDELSKVCLFSAIQQEFQNMIIDVALDGVQKNGKIEISKGMSEDRSFTHSLISMQARKQN
jgi:hypothetical protein